MAFIKKGNVLQTRIFRIKRTDTSATQVATLPSQSIIVGYRTFGKASDAGTSASVSLGTTSANCNELAVLDVKANDGAMMASGTLVSDVLDTSLAFNQQSTGIPIFAKYAESGTASTTGGDWAVLVEFI